MKKYTGMIPASYQKQENLFQGRKVMGLLENVDYSMNSHFRIWYNTQIEKYDLHQHNAMEIIIPIENQYEVIAADRRYLLNVGDILFIPKFVLHELLLQSHGARLIFLIDMELLSGFNDINSLDPLFMEPLLLNESTHPEIYDTVYSYFMQMKDIYFSSDILWEFSIFSLYMNILTTIGQNHYRIKPGSNTSLKNQQKYYDKFTNLLSYIDTHYSENLTLEQMASYVCFSKYHFSRLFKLHTNSTFYDYLSHKRIQAAQKLLASDLSITDISDRTGFNNPTSFCRCFKKYTNCSPSDYRSQFIENPPDNIKGL